MGSRGKNRDFRPFSNRLRPQPLNLDAGADLKARDRLGVTPLHWAAGFNESLAIITALLDAGADLKARDKDGETPWDRVKDRKPLKGSDAYYRLSEAQY